MVEELRFVARITRSGSGGRYAIVIPREVTERFRNLIEQWYRERTPLLVEVKVLHGGAGSGC